MKNNSRIRIKNNVLLLLTGSFLSLSHAQEVEKETDKLNKIEVIGYQQSYFVDTSSTAMKGEFLDKETPYSVEVVNQSIIEDLNADRLDHVFDYTTGMTDTGKLVDSVNVRGFDLGLENIQSNGMSGMISRFGSLPTSNVERVEVLKGPAAILYGSSKPGGLINIQTKLPQAEEAYSFRISTQTFDTAVSSFGNDVGAIATFDATGAINEDESLMYRFIFTGENTDGFRGDFNNENYYIYPSLLWQISEDTSLLMSLEAGHENRNADDGLFVAQYDISTAAGINTVYQQDNDYDNDEGIAFDTDFNHRINESLDYRFKWRSVWHKDERKVYENNRVNNIDMDTSESIADTTLRRRNRHQVNYRDWHGFDNYLTYNTDLAGFEHNFVFGLAGEYRKTDFNRKVFGGYASPDISIYNPGQDGYAGSNEGNRRETQYYNGAFYLQDKVNLTDNLILVGSGRLDRSKISYKCKRGSCADNNTDYSTNFVGSLGGIYEINDWVSAYASYGESFDPTTAERIDAEGKALDAEEAHQYEVGFKLGATENLNASLSYYHIKQRNVSESVGSGVYENIGKVRSKGFEADLQWLPMQNWQLKLGYAYNDAEVLNSNDRPAHTPRNTAYLFTQYNFPKRILGGEVGINAGITFRDNVYTSSSESSRVDLPSYSRYDVGLTYQVKNYKFALNIENLTDKRYYESGTNDYRIYVGEPRKYTLTFETRF